MSSPRDRQPDLPPVDWRGVGLRRTPQREVVLDLVRRCFDHPTADWIHREARRVIPDISLATVYRTLRILKERGLIHEFSGGASPSRFDGTVHEHEHVRCVRCGAVVDVEIPEMTELRNRVAERTRFRLGSFVFHGLCRECVERNGQNGQNGRNGDEDPDRRREDYW